MTGLTHYDDINEIAVFLTEGLINILGDRLAGFYLTGSLTYGGFDRPSSDLDFYAIINSPLSDDQRASIEDLHLTVEKRYPEWAERIEVPYVLKEMLGSVMPPQATRPLFNAGEMWKPDPPFGDNWLINLYALRERGVALYGPEPKELIPPISMEDVRAASARDMRDRWVPKLESSEPFGDGKHWTTSHLQAYSVLTMCRVLYRFRNDGVVSKRAAAKWFEAEYPEWKALIERAEKWRMGQPFDAWSETLDLIRFTLGKIGVLNKS